MKPGSWLILMYSSGNSSVMVGEGIGSTTRSIRNPTSTNSAQVFERG